MLFQRREGEHLEGTERSFGVTHPTCSPVGQLEWKRTSPHLRGLRGKQWLVPTQSKLGHGFWFPAQGSVVRLPQAGAGLRGSGSLLLKTQAKQAVLLSGKQPVQINTQYSDQPHMLHSLIFSTITRHKEIPAKPSPQVRKASRSS